MPYPSEHSARVKEPSSFQKDSFRRIKLPKSKGGKGGISVIIGKLKGESKTTAQAYRFPKDLYSPEEAKKWLGENNIKYISFEAASGDVQNAIYDEELSRNLDSLIIFNRNIESSCIELNNSKISDKNIGKYKVLYFAGDGEEHTNVFTFKLNSTVFNELKDNFYKKVVGTELPVNFSHEKSGKAAGWIQDVELSGENNNELWITIKWNPSGVEAIKQEEFKYLSLEFHSESCPFYNKQTKKKMNNVIRGCALTNIPFMSDAKVALNDLIENIISNNDESQEGKKFKKGEVKMSTKNELLIALKSEHDIDVISLQEENKQLSEIKVNLENQLSEAQKEKENSINELSEFKSKVESEKIDKFLQELIDKGQSTQALNDSIYRETCKTLGFDKAKVSLSALPKVVKTERKSDGAANNDVELSDEQKLDAEIKLYAKENNLSLATDKDYVVALESLERKKQLEKAGF